MRRWPAAGGWVLLGIVVDIVILCEGRVHVENARGPSFLNNVNLGHIGDVENLNTPFKSDLGGSIFSFWLLRPCFGQHELPIYSFPGLRRCLLVSIKDQVELQGLRQI
jgi:hypothetical protein